MVIKAKSAGALVVFLALGVILRAQNADPLGAQDRRFLAAVSAQMLEPVGKYVGPGSCSAVACHGGIQPQSKTKVLQNEYSTWVTEDKHARAYSALSGPLSRQMTSILKIEPAEKSKKCLVCHALSVDPGQRAREFDVAEGVSCESCHGPASAWLGPHIQPTANHMDMVRLGLVDNKNLGFRSERCLSCHLGAKGMEVDHEMIAAGHPDLTFELDSFTAVEPPHWVEKSADPLFGMRAWGIGQAVQMREGMFRIARRAHAGPWPEFSEMDCITCHHALTGPESWRQKEGYADRRAGDPPYNLARFVVFRHFAREIDPATTQEMEASTTQVARLVTAMSPDRGAVESAATRAAKLADKLVAEVGAARYDRARTERLLRNIASDGDMISRQGERTAEQATMTIDSLYIAVAKAGGTNAETRSAIDKLFMQVKNPSGYNAPQFAAQMKSVATTLH
jgi:Cytochrome c554 and c-prime